MRRAGSILTAVWLGVSALLAAPGDESGARVQQLVTQIEGRSRAFRNDLTVPASRAALFRGDLADARAALEQLAALGEPAIAGLVRLLHNRSAQCRANAAYGLSLVGGPRIVAALQDAVVDDNAAVRYQVAVALGYSASPAALAPLNTLAGDKDTAVRAAAVQTGGILRDILTAEQAATPEQKIAELIPLLSADMAVARLASYGAAAVPALLQALNAQDRGVQNGAADCLSRTGDPRGMEALYTKFTASLNGPPETKYAQYLAAYHSPEVWSWLLKLLNDPNLDEKAPEAVYYALERVGSTDRQDRLEVVHAYLKRVMTAGQHKVPSRAPTTTVNPIGAACEVLGRIGDKTSLPIVEQIINEAPPAAKSIIRPLAEAAKAAIEKRG
ncbi:MAG: HEAT repeat domain-containing protein [Armatimonadetes bacterium]|nr:HEAT repeat domain-containing protein [Armatimonadota bacterium]